MKTISPTRRHCDPTLGLASLISDVVIRFFRMHMLLSATGHRGRLMSVGRPSHRPIQHPVREGMARSLLGMEPPGAALATPHAALHPFADRPVLRQEQLRGLVVGPEARLEVRPPDDGC